MCGIAGLSHIGERIEPRMIRMMTDLLKHRGPDDEGYLAVDTCADPMSVCHLRGPDSTCHDVPLWSEFKGDAQLYLGHRRLSILDLSPRGHQPMQYGQSLWIVYNGEIYNYVELRRELMAEGYDFASNTDTEVILAAYDRWGEECTTRFNGDWAFCILDMRRRNLFLSRDRYSIKPLYYFRDRYLFAFASEIKSLLCLPFVSRSLNLDKAFQSLVLSLVDDTGETLFKDVCQMVPGHNMTVCLQTGAICSHRYYELAPCTEIGKYDHRKALAYAENLRDLVFDAVRLRLRADVPVGSCLSGGLDSSSIVAIMKTILGETPGTQVQHTFTSSFPNLPIDERRFAELIVEYTKANGHFVYPSKEVFISNLSGLLHCHDEPFSGSSVYAQWEVMREASRHVKVTLDGQGADEVFAGYPDTHASFLASLLLNGRAHSLLAELWGLAWQKRNPKEIARTLKLVLLCVLPNSWKRRAFRVVRHRESAWFRDRLGPGVDDGLGQLESIFKGNLNELLAYFTTTSSLPTLLKYADRNSMAYSIETRMPFTDYRVVDFGFTLPAVYKIRHGWTKWILRLAMRDLVPHEIVWRRDKLGFAAPPWLSKQEIWNTWLRADGATGCT